MGKKERDKKIEMPVLIQPELPFIDLPLPNPVKSEVPYAENSIVAGVHRVEKLAEMQDKLFEQADLLEQRKIGGLDNLFAVVREIRRLREEEQLAAAMSE